MRYRTFAAVATLGSVALAGRMKAQGSLLPGTSAGIAPVFSSWHFNTPIALEGGSLKGARQVAVPLRFRALLRGNWTFDAAGAFVSGSAEVESSNVSRTLTLNGLTDIRLRATHSMFGESVLLTLGANLPTGKTGLSADETSALQVVGAPALQMPASALGLGASGTVGLSVGRQVGEWALAFGGSVEKRTEYTAIDFALEDGNALTKVSPGTAAHITAGLDRALGQRRLSALFVVDHYSEDAISIEQGDVAADEARYTLGTQLTGSIGVDFGGGSWRTGQFALSVRHRGAFSDQAGESVEGSDATYIESSWTGVRGRATGRGLILGVNFRQHTGSPVSSSMAAAAASVGGATVGLEFPSTNKTFRIATQVQYGQFDTGVTKTNGLGFSVMASYAAAK
jgi:hypothetical protein